MVHTTVNEGIDTLTYYSGLMAGDRKRSDDNPYIDWLNDERVTFYEEADYGNDWAGGGGGVDVATTFPASPSKGVSFLRLNTNTSELRLYYYNGSSWVAINQSDQIQVDVVPSPTPTYSTLQDVMDTLHSAGIISGGTITDGGSETIDVAAGTGAIKTADSEIANLRLFDWAAETSLSIPTNTTRHVGIDYNSGSPQVLLSATISTFNDHDKIHLGGIVNEGGTLHIQNIPHEVVSGVGHTIERFIDTEHFQRGSGLILGESGDGNRYVTVTAGTIWERLTKFSPSAVDTNPGGGADDFDIYYRDGGSGFTKVSAQTIWDNDSYDDNSGTLQPMTTNWYAQIWFYIELDGELVAQYGRSEAATLAMVESEAPPSTAPDRINEHALLIGRILFQNGGTTPQDVQSVFEQAFNSAGVFDHGGLAGLSDNDHTQYLLIADIDNTPVDSELNAPISSNWAYDHINTVSDPHGDRAFASGLDHDHATPIGVHAAASDPHQDRAYSDSLDHHTIVSTLAALDTTMTGAQLEDLTSFTSTNKGEIPMTPVPFNGDNYNFTNAANIRSSNDGGTHTLDFALPLPYTLGALTLHIDQIRFKMVNADGSAFFENMRLWAVGVTSPADTKIWESTTNITSGGLKTFDLDTDGTTTLTLTNNDLGTPYKTMFMNILIDKGTSSTQPEFSPILMRFWYE